MSGHSKWANIKHKKEATDKKKEDIISGRQQDAFYKLYEEWTADLESKWSYKDDVDQVLWKEVVLHSEESTATEAETETTPAADEATEAATTGAQEQATEATTEAKK